MENPNYPGEESLSKLSVRDAHIFARQVTIRCFANLSLDPAADTRTEALAAFLEEAASRIAAEAEILRRGGVRRCDV